MTDEEKERFLVTERKERDRAAEGLDNAAKALLTAFNALAKLSALARQFRDDAFAREMAEDVVLELNNALDLANKQMQSGVATLLGQDPSKARTLNPPATIDPATGRFF